jgi:hypothetical protein
VRHHHHNKSVETTPNPNEIQERAAICFNAPPVPVELVLGLEPLAVPDGLAGVPDPPADDAEVLFPSGVVTLQRNKRHC